MAVALRSGLAGLALFGDMVMAMITVTWATGINRQFKSARLPTEPGARGSWRLSLRFLVPDDFSLDALIERERALHCALVHSGHARSPGYSR